MMSRKGITIAVKPRGADEATDVTFDKDFIKYKIALQLYSAHAKADEAKDILESVIEEYLDLYTDIDDERLEQSLSNLRKTGLTKDEIKQLAEKL